MVQDDSVFFTDYSLLVTCHCIERIERGIPMIKYFLIGLLTLVFLVGCSNPPAPTPTPIPLAISEVSSLCGVAGETVIIKGTSFGNSQGSSLVTFNGVTAAVTSWSNTQISALVPNAAFTGDVVVRVNGVNSNGIRFTIPCDGPNQHIIELK